MDKNIKLRFISGVVATTLAVGGTLMLSNEPNAYADTIVKKKFGTFIEDFDPYEEGEYVKYIVQKGDNLSNISRRVCRYFEKNITTKYWPVIAYLNEYPRTIHVGDEVIFPSNFEDMDELLKTLDESGWITSYRRLLKKRKEIKAKYIEDNKDNTVGAIIDDIYGEGKSSDKDFVKRYLSVVGLSSSYNETTILSKDEIFKLTESIPSLEELEVKVKKK